MIIRSAPKDSATIEKLTVSKRLKGMFDGSLHSWEEWMIVSLAFVAAAGIFVVVATRQVVHLTRLELTAANERTEELRRDNLVVQRELETEKTERLGLENFLAPRSIPREKHDAIVKALTPLAGQKVKVVSYALDTEGVWYASQLASALKTAGLEIEDQIGKYTPPQGVGFTHGLHVIGDNRDLVMKVLLAFLNNGLGGSNEDQSPSPVVVVFVGVKPVTNWLEAKVAPRTINDEGHRRLTEKFKSLQGARIDLFADTRGTTDTVPLGDRLAEAFRAAGVNLKYSKITAGERPRFGIEINQQVGLVGPELAQRKLLIVDALNAESLGAFGGPPIGSGFWWTVTPPWDASDTAPVRVVVGSKPTQ